MIGVRLRPPILPSPVRRVNSSRRRALRSAERLVAAVCDEIAAIDLALHVEAAFLEEPLDRQIERSFAERRGFAYRALSHGRVAAVSMPDRKRNFAAAAKPLAGRRVYASYLE